MDQAYNAVKRICQKNRIQPSNLYKGSRSKPVAQARREIIRKLTQMGVGTERIANFCGVEASAVYYHRSGAALGAGNAYYKNLREPAHAADLSALQS